MEPTCRCRPSMTCYTHSLSSLFLPHLSLSQGGVGWGHIIVTGQAGHGHAWMHLEDQEAPICNVGTGLQCAPCLGAHSRSICEYLSNGKEDLVNEPHKGDELQHCLSVSEDEVFAASKADECSAVFCLICSWGTGDEGLPNLILQILIPTQG